MRKEQIHEVHRRCEEREKQAGKVDERREVQPEPEGHGALCHDEGKLHRDREEAKALFYPDWSGEEWGDIEVPHAIEVLEGVLKYDLKSGMSLDAYIKSTWRSIT